MSTHSLFAMIDENTLKYLKEYNYTLILDEVFNVVEEIKITKSDREILLRDKVDVSEDGKLTWIDKNYKGILFRYKNAIEKGDCYIYDNCFMLWTFPVSIMKALKHTYILTYMFTGQIQRYYYDMNNVEYEYKSVNKINNKYEIVDYNKHEDLSHIKDLINICDDSKLNKIGEDKYALSKSWYMKQDENKGDGFDVLKNNMYNYFRHKVKGKGQDNMFTCFKDFKNQCKGKGYSKGFVSCNARATNEYRHKKNLAYVVNIFNNPMILKFFRSKDVEVDENTFALSELIQWMFRSQLRDGKEINIYIPSKRMRILLENWLQQ